MFDKIQKLLEQKGMLREGPTINSNLPSSPNSSCGSPKEFDPKVPYSPRSNCIFNLIE